MPWEEEDTGGSLLSWLRGNTVPCRGRRGTLGRKPSLSWALQNLKSLLFPWRHMSVNCHTEVSWEARVAWGVGKEEALLQSDHELALASCCV